MPCSKPSKPPKPSIHKKMTIDPTTILQPSIFIGGLEIAEPVTTITDLMISGVSLYCWWKLRNANREGLKFKFFEWFFILTSIGTFFGGLIGHGFLYWFGAEWKLLGFYTGMFAVAAIERASILHAKPLIKQAWLGKFFLVLNMAELIFMMVYTALTLHFRFVEYHVAYGFLIVVLFFHTYVYYKIKDKGSLIIILNSFLLLVTVFIFNHPIILHTWFNHRDFAHIFMALSMWIILQACLKMEENPALAKE